MGFFDKLKKKKKKAGAEASSAEQDGQLGAQIDGPDASDSMTQSGATQVQATIVNEAPPVLETDSQVVSTPQARFAGTGFSDQEVEDRLQRFYAKFQANKLDKLPEILEFAHSKGLTRLDEGLLKKYECCTGLGKIPGAKTLDQLGEEQEKQEQEELMQGDEQGEKNVSQGEDRPFSMEDIKMPQKPTPIYMDEPPPPQAVQPVLFKSLESALKSRRLEFLLGDLHSLGVEDFIDLARLDSVACKEPIWEGLDYMNKKKLKRLVNDAKDCVPGQSFSDETSAWNDNQAQPTSPVSTSSSGATTNASSVAAAALAVAAVNKFKKKQSVKSMQRENDGIIPEPKELESADLAKSAPPPPVPLPPPPLPKRHSEEENAEQVSPPPSLPKRHSEEENEKSTPPPPLPKRHLEEENAEQVSPPPSLPKRHSEEENEKSTPPPPLPKRHSEEEGNENMNPPPLPKRHSEEEGNENINPPPLPKRHSEEENAEQVSPPPPLPKPHSEEEIMEQASPPPPLPSRTSASHLTHAVSSEEEEGSSRNVSQEKGLQHVDKQNESSEQGADEQPNERVASHNSHAEEDSDNDKVAQENTNHHDESQDVDQQAEIGEEEDAQETVLVVDEEEQARLARQEQVLAKLARAEARAQAEREALAASASGKSDALEIHDAENSDADQSDDAPKQFSFVGAVPSVGASAEMKAILAARGSFKGRAASEDSESSGGAQDAAETPAEEEKGDKPCGNFRLDMAAATFNTCKCGFPKTEHCVVVSGASNSSNNSGKFGRQPSAIRMAQEKFKPPVAPPPVPKSTEPVSSTAQDVAEPKPALAVPPPVPKNAAEPVPTSQDVAEPEPARDAATAPPVPKTTTEPEPPSQDFCDSAAPSLKTPVVELPTSASTSIAACATPVAAVPDDQVVDYRSKVEAFYREHNPENLANLDRIMQKFKGREEELFQKLAAKYSTTT